MIDEPQKIILRGRQEYLKPLITEILAINQVLKGKDVGVNYSIPVTTFQDYWTFAPQVKLMFYQSKREVTGTNPPATGEISYRIMGETPATMNPSKALAIANKIKLEFATGSLTVWRKGKLKITYLDKTKGYDFRLLVHAEANARSLIGKVLDLNGHSPEWERLGFHGTYQTFPEPPPLDLVYGERRKGVRRRPTEDMKFRYAEMHLHGLTYAVTLLDTTKERPAPLLTA